MAVVTTRNYEHPKVVVIQPGYGVTGNAAVYKNTLTFNNERPTLPAGLFVAKVGTQERFLPRGELTQGLTTTSNVLKVSVTEVFAPGDTMYALEPSLAVAAATFVAGQVYRVNVEGQIALIDLTGTLVGTVAQNVISKVAGSLLDEYISVIEIPTGYLFVGKDVYTLSLVQIANNATPGTLIINAPLATNQGTAIGTIGSYDAINDQFILAANSTIALPSKIKVGVKVNEIIGLAIESYSFLDREFVNVALTTSNLRTYTDRLPYIDGQIKNRLQNLNFD